MQIKQLLDGLFEATPIRPLLDGSLEVMRIKQLPDGSSGNNLQDLKQKRPERVFFLAYSWLACNLKIDFLDKHAVHEKIVVNSRVYDFPIDCLYVS